MAKAQFLIYPEDLQKWGDRLAAENWQWVTWKFVLLDFLIVFGWLVCFSYFVLCVYRVVAYLFGKRRPQDAIMNPVKPLIVMYFVAFFAGGWAHSALFKAGPFGYYMQNWLGDETFAKWNEITGVYMTLIGHIFS